MIFFAHRGDPAHAPENTLASLKQAAAKGARAVEMDVRCSADGIWVVFHDPTLKRTTGRRGRVARTPWAVLSQQDAGRWFSPQCAGEPIPRLDQALEFCRQEGLDVFLDLKVNRQEPELARFLHRSDWFGHVSLGAGKIASLRRWTRLLHGQPLFWVTDVRVRVTPARIQEAVRLKLTGLAVYKRWATKKSVEQVHRAGLKLYVWTIRTARDSKRFESLGVDGIMSEVWPHHPIYVPEAHQSSRPIRSPSKEIA